MKEELVEVTERFGVPGCRPICNDHINAQASRHAVADLTDEVMQEMRDRSSGSELAHLVGKFLWDAKTRYVVEMNATEEGAA